MILEINVMNEINEIKISVKQHDDKIVIEFISEKRKFKAGDKVRIKNGVSSKSQGGVYPYFEDFLDQYRGKVMTVKKHITTDVGEYITTDEAKEGDHYFGFAEDWLELYVEKQQRKFKAGDKVKIRDGISSESHINIRPYFISMMDEFIGKELTVEKYNGRGFVVFLENSLGYQFHEDWLEPCVEDIPKRKFQKGDKVKIKNGVSSKTYRHIAPTFLEEMDNLIGKTMTVESYSYWDKYVDCEETVYSFLEEWLEPYVEALKNGDLAIFWDDKTSYATIRVYDVKGNDCHYDNCGTPWRNAIKFESKEQFEKVLRGEI